MTQYQKISKQIDYLERIDTESSSGIELSRWCADQITWAYKWKKITYEQMSELCVRMIQLFGGNI